MWFLIFCFAMILIPAILGEISNHRFGKKLDAEYKIKHIELDRKHRMEMQRIKGLMNE